MDIKQIKYFLAVAESGGFSKAAQLIHIAQPALSAHVARLEAELGVKLFLRNTKGIELTHAGETLMDHARDILRRLQHAQDAVRHAADELHGEVVLGLPTTVAMVLTLPLLKEVRTHWPHITLRLVEGHSGWLQEWLLAGRIDAAVLFGTTAHKGLKVQSILNEDLYLVSAANASTLPTSDAITMHELAACELIVPAKEHGLRKAWGTPSCHGLQSPKKSREVNWWPGESSTPMSAAPWCMRCVTSPSRTARNRSSPIWSKRKSAYWSTQAVGARNCRYRPREYPQ
jgi:LysR family nitrogen assimilation transcriptional regulator